MKHVDSNSYQVYMNPYSSRGFGVRVGDAHLPIRSLSEAELIRKRAMVFKGQTSYIKRNIELLKSGFNLESQSQ